jgi:hypothetical protein
MMPTRKYIDGPSREQHIHRIRGIDQTVTFPCPDCLSLNANCGAALEKIDELISLLHRYRDAHRSMALIGQEAGAAAKYKAITEEVDAWLLKE